jgi:ferredoxin-type protein NapF
VVDASRRNFFRGRPRPKIETRPPWALPETSFTDRCTRCNDCLDVCPEQIIVSGDGGFPTINFQLGECTFCGECVAACKPLALIRLESQAAWTHKALIGPTCLPERGIECRTCGDFCQANAIRFSPRLGGSPIPVIEAEKCTGCGACLAPCPVNAIAIIR